MIVSQKHFLVGQAREPEDIWKGGSYPRFTEMLWNVSKWKIYQDIVEVSYFLKGPVWTQPPPFCAGLFIVA